MADWVRLCGVAEAPAEGQLLGIEVAGVPVCIVRVGGEVRAIGGVCPHRGAPLAEGWVEGGKVVCPWHSWEFDPMTGRAVYPEGEQVAAYALRVNGDDLMVCAGEA